MLSWTFFKDKGLAVVPPWTAAIHLDHEHSMKSFDKSMILVWIGHMLRKNHKSIERQALDWDTQGKRRQGRSRWTLNLETNRSESSKRTYGWSPLLGVIWTSNYSKSYPCAPVYWNSRKKSLINPKISSNQWNYLYLQSLISVQCHWQLD